MSEDGQVRKCLTIAAGVVLLLIWPVIFLEPAPDIPIWDTATSALTVMQASWYNGFGGWVDHESISADWGRANYVENIANYMDYTNSTAYDNVIEDNYKNQPADFFHWTYFDDILWWALAYLRSGELYARRGDKLRATKYRTRAADVFAWVAQNAWDDTCGGGVYWSNDTRYKNAITNELFITTAMRLHNVDRNETFYLNWAIKGWTWFNQSGMINSKYLINDGLNSTCGNNGQPTWTYNQGVILGGLGMLYKATNNVAYLRMGERIGSAVMSNLVDKDGILTEVGCGDGALFKGILTRYIRYFVDTTGTALKDKLESFLQINARRVWDKAQDQYGYFASHWQGNGNASADPSLQSSALDLFLAARLGVSPDECASVKCQSGANCIGGRCICPRNTTGQLCETNLTFAQAFDSKHLYFVTNLGHYLSSVNSTVYTAPYGKAPGLFLVSAQSGDRVALESTTQRYLSSNSNGDVLTQSFVVAETMFKPTPVQSLWGLQTIYNRYITGQNESVITTPALGAAAQFKLSYPPFCVQ